MPRHSGFGRVMGEVARAAARQAAVQAREAQRQARAAERDARLWDKQRRHDEARSYLLSRIDLSALENDDLASIITAVETVLLSAVTVSDHMAPFSLASLKRYPVHPPFDPSGLHVAEIEPRLSAFLPLPLEGMARRWPAAKRRYEAELAAAHTEYETAQHDYRAREAARRAALEARRAAYDATIRTTDEQAATDNAGIDAWQAALEDGQPEAIVSYCALMLVQREDPDAWPPAPGDDRIAYAPESRQLVVELDLPDFSVVPAIGAYKYVKSTDQITTTARPLAQRKALYGSLVAQLTLRTLFDLFHSAAAPHIDTLVLNGYVDAIDEGTGRAIRPCLVTVRVTRDLWDQLDLRRVDPIACLKVLNAAVSRSPAELAPVRPVMELSMVDARFIAQEDILSDLDGRQNLMELTPGAFEALIANLFGKMGLETRLTQASRDGGVDCVAYDTRPIFGGKVVIQAKRYKHTVGVSAVRDLYGTMQNEGASKGILVTTSGYGKAAFEFAAGKPLELLSGSHLLSLLSEHAGIEAKIDIPDGWRDPVADVANDGG